MNLLLVTVGILVAGLLGLLLWATFRKAAGKKLIKRDLEGISLTCHHLLNLSQIRQALDEADYAYLLKKLDAKSARNVRKERSRIALKYLHGLRQDFEQLMGGAQVIASLSPEVEAKEEWKRLRLSIEFKIKYQLVRTKFAIRAPAFSGLQNLAQLVSSFAMDLERTITEIGIAGIGPAAHISAQS